MEAFEQLQSFLLELRDAYGFHLQVEKLERCLACARNITDLEEVFYRMQSIACTSEEEAETFRNLFAQRLLHYAPENAPAGQDAKQAAEQARQRFQRLLAEASRQKQVLSNAEDARERAEQALEKALQELEKRRNAVMPQKERVQSVQDSNAPNPNHPALQELLQKVAEQLKALAQAAAAEETHIDTDALAQRIRRAMETHTYKQSLEAITKEQMSAARKLHGKKQTFGELLKLVDLIKKLQSAAGKTISAGAKKELQQVNAQIREAKTDLGALEKKVQALRDESKRAQQRVEWQREETAATDARAAAAEQKHQDLQRAADLVVKERSLDHRAVFTEGIQAVQTTGEIDDLMRAQLTNLSRENQEKVLTFIRTNARVFRQTLRRKHASHQRRQVDVRATVRAAARTNGEPLLIKYRKPFESHAKVIIVADISGSCRHTATLALYFAAMMEEAFPGGCKKFAFVRDLNAVDRYFRERSPEDGVREVYEHIQTRGVYSDYGTTIRQLREEYGGTVHRDTTILFLGDARNNRNQSRAEDLKYLADRSRQVFWLNPEPKTQWDTGDSVMGQYLAAGAQGYCVRNVGELLQFLMNVS